MQMASGEAGEMFLPILGWLGWGFIPLAAGNERLEGRKALGQTALPPLRAAVSALIALGNFNKGFCS